MIGCETLKNIKYIIIGILICILIAGTIILKRVNIDIKEAYISIGNSSLIEVKDDNWKYVASNRLSNFEWNKFDIYAGNEYIGNYNIQYNNIWYIFDDNYNSVNYNNMLFMIRDTNSYLYDFERKEINDDDLVDVKKNLDKLKIVYEDGKIGGYKIYIDIDDDGVNEVLFNIGDISDDTISDDGTIINDNYGNIYSLIYLVKDDKIYFLEKSIQNQEDYYTMPYYDIAYIAKIGNNNNYKFIIYKSYFGSEDINCYSVYEFKNNKIKTLLKAELDYGADNNITNNRDFSLSTIILTISLLGGIVGFVAIMFYLKQKANNEI